MPPFPQMMGQKQCSKLQSKEPCQMPAPKSPESQYLPVSSTLQLQDTFYLYNLTSP
jgi:hypothetical protein